MRHEGLMVVAVLLTVGDRGIADHPKDKLAKEPTKPRVGCTTFLFEGKGDFRLQKKVYPAQNPKHYIESVRLIKRTSFYKCEPIIEKYGITEDGHSWWVDKGCEAVFEVIECPNDGKIPPPDIYRNMYEELRKRLKDATQNVDLTNFNLNSIHSRFEFQPEPIVRKNSV